MVNNGTAVASSPYQYFRLSTAKLGREHAKHARGRNINWGPRTRHRTHIDARLDDCHGGSVLASARDCFFPEQPYLSKLLAYRRKIYTADISVEICWIPGANTVTQSNPTFQSIHSSPPAPRYTRLRRVMLDAQLLSSRGDS